MGNSNLTMAKKAANDEFYTMYSAIEKEVNAYLEYDPDVFRDKVILLPCDDPEWSNFTKYFAINFQKFGIKKLISTGMAQGTETQGKLFTLEHDVNGDGIVNINDLSWKHLTGNGDFRSEEVILLRNEADIIVTNPPFSKFREFMAWIMAGEKKFLIIGNKNAVTYKEIFPLIKENLIWSGATSWGSLHFTTPENPNGTEAVPAVWFTNLDHGRRHKPLVLMTMADNIKHSKHECIRTAGYPKYDNYDAIEVSFVDAIPSDYDGVMGVPISFLDKYCPDQFEILGASDNGAVDQKYKLQHFKKHNEPYINGQKQYKRIFIQHRPQLIMIVDLPKEHTQLKIRPPKIEGYGIVIDMLDKNGNLQGKTCVGNDTFDISIYTNNLQQKIQKQERENE